MRTSRTALAGLAVTSLGLVACGGDASSTPEPAALTTYTGTVAELLDDASTLDYSVDLPEGFAISEFSSGSNVVWEDPDAEFGTSEITVRLSWTPVTYDASTLEADALGIDPERQILDTGTDGELSYVTFATPSESSDMIFSAHAQSALLVEGTNMLCSATWATGIGDEWDDDDVAAAADQALTICRSYVPA